MVHGKLLSPDWVVCIMQQRLTGSTNGAASSFVYTRFPRIASTLHIIYKYRTVMLLDVVERGRIRRVATPSFLR